MRSSVKKIALGPAHIALLLEDGRICRVSFSVISDRLDLTKNDPTKRYMLTYFILLQFYQCILICSTNNGTTGGSGSSGGGGGSSGSTGNSKPTGSSRQIRTRTRIMRSNTAIRGGNNSGKLFSKYL